MTKNNRDPVQIKESRIVRSLSPRLFPICILLCLTCTEYRQDNPFDTAGTDWHQSTLAAMQDTSVFTGYTIHLHAAAYAPYSTISYYQWIIDNGAPIVTTKSYFDTAFSTEGTKTIQVMAFDQNGVPSNNEAFLVKVKNKPTYYTYTLINETDVSLYYSLGDPLVQGSIPTNDSIQISRVPGESRKVGLMVWPQVLDPLNAFNWEDSIASEMDHRMTYSITGNQFFLLRITNNTNKYMSYVVVRNSKINDSSLVFIGIGETQNVGYYPSTSSTNIAAYYINGGQYSYWSSCNTVNTLNRPLILNLSASGTIKDAN